MLIGIIIALDQLMWRPLVAWSEKFRFEQTESGDTATSPVLTALRRSALLEWLSEQALPRTVDTFDRLRPRRQSLAPSGAPPRTNARLVKAGRVVLLVVFGTGAAWGAFSLAQLLASLNPQDWFAILPAATATFLRTGLALLIGTLWTVPVGVAIGLNPRLARRAQPLVQVAASIPATALFPVLLLVLIGLPGGLN